MWNIESTLSENEPILNKPRHLDRKINFNRPRPFFIKDCKSMTEAL